MCSCGSHQSIRSSVRLWRFRGDCGIIQFSFARRSTLIPVSLVVCCPACFPAPHLYCASFGFALLCTLASPRHGRPLVLTPPPSPLSRPSLSRLASLLSLFRAKLVVFFVFVFVFFSFFPLLALPFPLSSPLCLYALQRRRQAPRPHSFGRPIRLLLCRCFFSFRSFPRCHPRPAFFLFAFFSSPPSRHGCRLRLPIAPHQVSLGLPETASGLARRSRLLGFVSLLFK